MNAKLFDRILVGVDGSPAGFVALDQGRRLLAPDGDLRAVVVCQERLAVHAGFEAPRLAREIHAEAEATAARARNELRELPAATVEVVHGRPTACLRIVAREMQATLIVVGSHSHSRAAGMILGSVATELLHDAPASVLIARGVGDAGSFPRRIVVGTDGSGPASRAVAAARELRARLGAEMSIVVAEAGRDLDHDRLAELGGLERDPRPPVDALLAHAAEADLLVVGRRGLHGVGALGSVSERVAHRAVCSVLVVHDAAAS